MQSGFKRAVAFASAILVFGAGVSAHGSDAVAQDRLVAEPVLTDADDIVEAGPADEAVDIRFVASAVVQDIPETPPTPDPAQARQVVAQPAAQGSGQASNLRALVRATPVDGDMSREMRCLAQAVYFESRGEPLAGQLAVAQVVINRADSHLFPDDYCSVVTQRAQFSFVRGGRIPQPKTSSSAWRRARAIARIAHRGLWESEADDALYFHANYVKPRWARNKVARARIKTHIFYR